MVKLHRSAYALGALALALVAWVATSPIAAFAEGDWG